MHWLHILLRYWNRWSEVILKSRVQPRIASDAMVLLLTHSLCGRFRDCFPSDESRSMCPTRSLPPDGRHQMLVLLVNHSRRIVHAKAQAGICRA